MSYVRRYIERDFPQVLDMARSFHQESPVHSRFPFEDARVFNLLDEARKNDQWLPAVCVDGDEIIGMMLLFCVPMFFGPALEVGDLTLFVRRDRRGSRTALKLLEHGFDWAKGKGAAVVRLGITTGIRDEATERLLTKIGFRRCGLQLEQTL